MKIILSKDDIEALVKKYYGMDAVAWQNDGTIVLDTTLEKIINDPTTKTNFDTSIYNNATLFPITTKGPFPLLKK